MTRKIALIAVLALILSLAIGGVLSTGAWFKDVSTSQSNNVTAGIIDLKVDSDPDNATATVPAKMVIDKLVPGTYTTVATVKLTNTGDVDAVLSANIFNIVNTENQIEGPELVLGDTDAVGELGPRLSIVLKQNWGPNWHNFQYMTGLVDDTTLSTAVYDDGSVQIIPAHTTLEFQLNVYWEEAASFNDNWAMGDSVTFDFQFVLDQIHA